MTVLHGYWQPKDDRPTLTTVVNTPVGNGGSLSSPSTAGLPSGGLFVWGETWRPLASGRGPAIWEIFDHPLALGAEELRAAFDAWPGAIAALKLARPLTRSIALPSPLGAAAPLLSAVDPASDLGGDPGDDLDDDPPADPNPESNDRPRDSCARAIAAPLLVDPLGRAIALWPWWVEGLWLPPAAAVAFLQALPLALTPQAARLGSGLRFWSQVARWSLDLTARYQARPELVVGDSGAIAQWHPLLEAARDRARFDRLARQMPPACRTAQPGDKPTPAKTSSRGSATTRATTVRPQAHRLVSVALPGDPGELLQDFLTAVVDVRLRAAAASLPLPGERPPTRAGLKRTTPTTRPSSTALPVAEPVRDWLRQLGSTSGVCQSSLGELEPLGRSLQGWTAAIATTPRQANDFRPAVALRPPDKPRQPWRLEFGLQAIDDDDLWLPAAVVWRYAVEGLRLGTRRIWQPQETLLRGLGWAARLWPILAASLEGPCPCGADLTPAEAYQFLKLHLARFQDSGLGVVVPPSLRSRAGLASRLGLELAAEAESEAIAPPSLGIGSLLNFRWQLVIGNQRLSQAEFEQLLAGVDLEAMPLVNVKGEWVELRPNDVRSAREFFVQRQGKVSLSVGEVLRVAMGETAMVDRLPILQFESSGPIAELMAAFDTHDSLEQVPQPQGLVGQLRPYQQRGVAWLAFLERWNLGACLADDMGLGKTISLLALLLHLKERDRLNGPTLLICPTSILGNWEREAKKFAPGLRLLLHYGPNRPKGQALARAAAEVDLVLTSYALVFRDEMTLQAVPWRAVVLDEAQNIKNNDAKQSQSVKRLVELSERRSVPQNAAPASRDPQEEEAPPIKTLPFRIALTGTPVENRLSELWSIMEFLNPGYLGSEAFFRRRFAMPIERYGDGASLQALRSLVQPFILRRLKTDKTIIQDLPEKQEMVVFCGLGEKQAALYQALVEKSLVAIESSEGIQRRGQILALLVRLKQLCNHPALLETGESEELVDPGTNLDAISAVSETGSGAAIRGKDKKLIEISPADSPKLQRLSEMLEELLAEGDRALIFTQFARWGDLLRHFLATQLGEEPLFFHGGLNQRQREAVIDRFQNDPQGPKILILSLKAGGVGLNLTRANHVFHYDRWWNPAVENQATDRAFRIGQTRNVQVHKFVCSGTLEEKIHDIIESKKALAENVVGTGETWLTELDTDGLRDLLLLDRSAIVTE